MSSKDEIRMLTWLEITGITQRGDSV